VAARYGPTRVDGEWLLVDGIADADVPRLLAELARGTVTSAPLLARGAGAIRSLARLRCEVAGDVEDEIGRVAGGGHVGGG
jgi:hypothetical protein